MKVGHDSKEWGIDLTECILRIKNEKAKLYLKLLSDFILEREKFKKFSVHTCNIQTRQPKYFLRVILKI